MTTTEKTDDPKTSSKRRAQLRLMGVLVLTAGIISAGVVYWLGTRTPDPRDDPAMASYYREQSRQAEIVYGQMGLLATQIWDGLKRPGTQAIIIATISTLIAAGCFFFARLPDCGEANST